MKIAISPYSCIKFILRIGAKCPYSQNKFNTRIRAQATPGLGPFFEGWSSPRAQTPCALIAFVTVNLSVSWGVRPLYPTCVPNKWKFSGNQHFFCKFRPGLLPKIPGKATPGLGPFFKADDRIWPKYFGLWLRLLPIFYPFTEGWASFTQQVFLRSNNMPGTHIFVDFDLGPSPKFQGRQRQVRGLSFKSEDRPGHKSLVLWLRLSLVIYPFPERGPLYPTGVPEK